MSSTNQNSGVEPVNHLDLNARKWSRRSQDFDRKRFDYFRFLQERVIRLLPLERGLSFLDVGCGTGWAVLRVHQLLDGDGVFKGIDIASGMIEAATEHARGRRSIDFEVASADDLPFDDNSVDVCMCTNSFHHYPDPIAALREVQRVLKVGGSFFILDVTADALLLKLIDGIVASKEPEHVKFYATREFRQMFDEVGLLHARSKWIAFPEKVHIAVKVPQSKALAAG